MALLKFKKGLYGELPVAKAEGTVYITTDEKAMYVDISSTERIRIGQIITLASKDLTPPYSTESFYYLTDINALVKWNGSAWVQLNSTGDLATRISTLETTVGDSKSGLVKDVAAHGTDITALKATVGDSTTGLVKDVKDLQDEIDNIVTAGGEPNVIEKITVGGTLVPVDNETVALGKLAGVDAKVAETDLDTALSEKIGAIQATANAAATKTYVDGIVGAEGTLTKKVEANTSEITNIKNTLGNDFSTTATVTAAIRAINSKDTEQDGKISDIEKDITALETLTQEHGVTLTNHGTAIAANAELAQQGVDDAAAAAQAAAAADTKAGKAQTAAEGAQSTADAAKQLATANGTEIDTLKGKVQTLETNAATKAELSNQKTELEGKISAAQKAADDAQDAAEGAQTTANEAKQLATTNGTEIGQLKASVSTKVENSVYEAKVAELAGDIEEAAEAAATAQAKADENAGLIAKNTENITKNATDISKLKEDIGNISNIMNFRGAVIDTDSVVDPQPGDVVVIIDTGKEFVYDIYPNEAGESVGRWIEFGNSTATSGAIANLDSRLKTAEGKITTLEGTVGDANGGLVKDVASHTTAINEHTEDIAEIVAMLTWGTFGTTTA